MSFRRSIRRSDKTLLAFLCLPFSNPFRNIPISFLLCFIVSCRYQNLIRYGINVVFNFAPTSLHFELLEVYSILFLYSTNYKLYDLKSFLNCSNLHSVYFTSPASSIEIFLWDVEKCKLVVLSCEDMHFQFDASLLFFFLLIS